MFKQIRLTLLLIIGDLILTVIALWLTTYLRPWLELGKPLESSIIPLPVFGLTLIIWFHTFILLSIYHSNQRWRIIDELQAVAIGVAVATFVLSGALYFSYRHVSRLQILLFTGLDLLLLISFRMVIRLLFKRWRDSMRHAIRVLIVGAGVAGHNCARTLDYLNWTGLEVVGFLDDATDNHTGPWPILGRFDQLVSVIEAYHIREIVFALPLREHLRLANLIGEVQKTNVNIRLIPDYFDLSFLNARFENFRGIPLLTLREPVLDPFQRLLKRTFDMTIGALLLAVALIPMAFIALAIKLDSKGPIIFKQRRVGEDGQLFDMYKFRSMVVDAEQRVHEILVTTEEGHVIHKVQNDPRITRVGHILRATSLDELPQLFNVVRGDMSLVGPRPELPWLVEQYEDWQHKRFTVPQGITGWWQINGRSDKPLHLNTEYDLHYIKNYSLFLDLQILWKTIAAVVRRKGAY